MKKSTAMKVLLKEDIKYIRRVLSEIQNNLQYDEDYAGWCYKNEYLTDYFYNNENTLFNPKELEGYMEQIIEDEMKIKR